MPEVYLGLGSNLGHPYQQLNLAVQHIKALPLTSITEISKIYRSKALLRETAISLHFPSYLNAVLCMQTQLRPLALLNRLQAIEWAMGRRKVSARRWEPRTIDLDILFYGSSCIQSTRLTVPHPGIQQRDFVWFPLLEIASKQLITSTVFQQFEHLSSSFRARESCLKQSGQIIR